MTGKLWVLGIALAAVLVAGCVQSPSPASMSGSASSQSSATLPSPSPVIQSPTTPKPSPTPPKTIVIGTFSIEGKSADVGTYGTEVTVSIKNIGTSRREFFQCPTLKTDLGYTYEPTLCYRNMAADIGPGDESSGGWVYGSTKGQPIALLFGTREVAIPIPSPSTVPRSTLSLMADQVSEVAPSRTLGIDPAAIEKLATDISKGLTTTEVEVRLRALKVPEADITGLAAGFASAFKGGLLISKECFSLQSEPARDLANALRTDPNVQANRNLRFSSAGESKILIC